MGQSSKKEVEAYIKNANPKIKPIIKEIRQIVNNNFPEIEELISWRALCYKSNKYVLGINCTKDYVRLDFFNGAKLEDSNNLLRGVGSKLRHIKVRNVKEVDNNMTLIMKWIKESIAINNKKKNK